MSEEKNGNTAAKRYSLPRWWGVLLFLLIGFALFGENGLLRLYRSYQYAKSLEEDVATLQEKNRQLEHEISLLREDPDYIERIARERLGMVRKDEIVYQFQESRPVPEAPNMDEP